MHGRNRFKDSEVLTTTRTFTCALLINSALSGCADSQASVESTPVELRRVGDDGLTSRFADALEKALTSAPDFSITAGNSPGTFVILIPSNVDWDQSGDRLRVKYAVRFERIGIGPLGTSRGECWDSRLEDCATQVLRDARAIRTKRGNSAQ